MTSGAFIDGVVRVRVPATSANLGPGFDALGLALERHDELSGRVVAEGLHIDVVGEGNESVARDESHLVVRAMRHAFAALDATPPGLVVQCRNHIPHSRGLGSSAAAIVGGLLLARALVGDSDTVLSDADVLSLACEIEGHPDNVAPCLLGGLTVAWRDAASARAIRREIDPAITPFVLIPPTTASTELARDLLPATVPHRDAAFTAGRAALLVAALTGSPEALFEATEDRLHQSYRAPAMPVSAQLVHTLRAAGHAAVISGAGPTVLVLTRDVAEVTALVAHAPEGWSTQQIPVDRDGAVVWLDDRL